MPTEVLDEHFRDPVTARQEFIKAARYRSEELPVRGSSFFIHLSELCPVACEHCMYSSDLNRKSEKDSLSPAELEKAVAFIDSSMSEKLNITGGGEPFLKLQSILRLLETVHIPRIEIVTAGYWARTERAATRIIHKLADALSRNPASPEVLLRLSIDRYHIEAPRPVLISHYANVVEAWSAVRPGYALGFRSIQPDRGIVDRRLADAIGAQVIEVNEWNRTLVLPDGSGLPMTFNVFRRSGKAAELNTGHDGATKTIREYYGPFETAPGQLTLATAVNDAIRGAYRATQGLAVTLNSDGSFWIFCGTAPDRRLSILDHTFPNAVAYFFQDPITRLLVDEGIWALSDLVLELEPAVHRAALAKNDVASLVEDLLAPDDVRLAVTLLAARNLLMGGRMELPASHPLRGVLGDPRSDLLSECRDAIRRSREGQ